MQKQINSKQEKANEDDSQHHRWLILESNYVCPSPKRKRTCLISYHLVREREREREIERESVAMSPDRESVMARYRREERALERKTIGLMYMDKVCKTIVHPFFKPKMPFHICVSQFFPLGFKFRLNFHINKRHKS
ncbi:hypothetical protein KP509_12G063500 [Ceratopteris richardii]|uniref:Uncharacterized protein n=1 Tax=Ceratopteris richardii TaxID=49495 RepID=A0A8T2TP93_CERRI|nr:hypothetical protein KP509_12G063500 [Ceratopteris richardii]